MEDDQTLESYTEQQDQTPICWADQEYGMSSTAQSVDDKSSRGEMLASWVDQEETSDNEQNVDDKLSQSEPITSLANQENETSDNAQSVDDKSSRGEMLASWVDQEETSDNEQNVDDKLSQSEPITSLANQENETSDNAQSVDDESSQSEKLQNLSNAVRRREKNKPTVCKAWFNLWSRPSKYSLLTSKVKDFVNKKYRTSYSVETGWTKFRVNYKPLDRKLCIVMPVKFMGRTKLNDGSKEPLDKHELVGSESSRIPKGFKDAYKNSIGRVWSNKYKLCLNAVFPEKNKSCYDWANISPVEVFVSVNEEPKNVDAYKIYYVDRADYRDRTWADHVVFSKNAYENCDVDRHGGHNIFAHEFGHQIGLGDEYAVDDEAISLGDKIVHVYWTPYLTAYDRTENRVKYYNLGALSKKNGSFFIHNGKNYEVSDGVDDDGKEFYFLMEGGKIKDRALDGLYTRHTQMVADEFDLDDPEYANKNATMYDETEHNSQGAANNSQRLENNLMNKGNVFQKHYYIPFKKAMVNAIRSKYPSDYSDEAPNMDRDWKIV